jgi:hypothetical protein
MSIKIKATYVGQDGHGQAKKMTNCLLIKDAVTFGHAEHLAFKYFEDNDIEEPTLKAATVVTYDSIIEGYEGEFKFEVTLKGTAYDEGREHDVKYKILVDADDLNEAVNRVMEYTKQWQVNVLTSISGKQTDIIASIGLSEE